MLRACCVGPPVWVLRPDMLWNSGVAFRVGFKAPWKCPINKKHLVVHEHNEHIQTGRINILQRPFEQEMIPWSLSVRPKAISIGVRGTCAWFLALTSARRSTWMPIKSGIQPVGSLQITFQVHPRPPPPPTQQIHHHSQINYRRNKLSQCGPNLTTCFFNTLGTLAWELKLGSCCL